LLPRLGNDLGVQIAGGDDEDGFVGSDPATSVSLDPYLRTGVTSVMLDSYFRIDFVAGAVVDGGVTAFEQGPNEHEPGLAQSGVPRRNQSIVHGCAG
jgi:hypothetical protein